MARKKNERPQSLAAAAEKLIRKVYEDTRFNFGIKDEPGTKHYYIMTETPFTARIGTYI